MIVLWRRASAIGKVAALALLLLICVARGSRGQVAPDSGEPQPFRIVENLNLVVVEATVRDRNGQFAPDLTQQNFDIEEDGVRQSIRMFSHEDVPVTIGLVIDHSGSMAPRLAHVTAAARTFVEASNKNDEMFVVNFNEHVTMGLPTGIEFSDRPNELGSAILRAPATGQTALYDAIGTALDRLQHGTRNKKALIVISDGGDNASKLTQQEVQRKASESSALIYTVGVFDENDPDQNPGVLRHLARLTGGDSFLPSQLDEVVDVCRHIAADIRHQYTLGYVSGNTKGAAGFRSIKVAARAPGSKLTVRARAGYIPALAAPENGASQNGASK